MSEKFVKLLTRVLLGFVLVSVGFALGKEVTLRRQTPAPGADTATSEAVGDKVVVTYLHTTFRCATCNEIERLTKVLVETEFGEELKAGRIEWREVNFQEDEALAKRYEVVSSCVVVADVRAGKETGFQRLDDVWTRYQNPADFDEYVGAAIRKSLGESGRME